MCESTFHVYDHCFFSFYFPHMCADNNFQHLALPSCYANLILMQCSEILVARLLEKTKKITVFNTKIYELVILAIFCHCSSGCIARGSSSMNLSSDLETQIPPSHLELSSVRNHFHLSRRILH